jgi:gas vesicle protein
MRECKVSTNLAFLLAGMGIGAGVAILFAPKSGRETRRYVARRTGDGRNYVAAMGKELRRQAEDIVDKGKDWAAKIV